VLTRRVHGDPRSEAREETDPEQVAVLLAAAGLRWEPGPVPSDPEAAAVAEAARTAWPAWDIVRVGPDHPDASTMRARFLVEHTHAEDELRWFLADGGAFLLVVGDEVWRLACRAGDRVAVPRGVAHGFDPGDPPSFAAIRFLGDAQGWTPRPTGLDRIGCLAGVR
jgi:1,2-dihydroxy-3-keto-5-methylthiopentene dioxygenase